MKEIAEKKRCLDLQRVFKVTSTEKGKARCRRPSKGKETFANDATRRREIQGGEGGRRGKEDVDSGEGRKNSYARSRREKRSWKSACSGGEGGAGHETR